MNGLLIVNPTAGHGRAGRIAAPIAAQLRASGWQVETAFTLRAGDAKRLAAESEADRVIAVGGDGSVHEVAAGLIESGSRAVLGVVPAGSGNDFGRALGMPRKLSEVAHALRGAQPTRVDYGRVEWETATRSGASIFVNAVGCGFDAYVADRARHVRHLRGYVRYLVAVFRSLGTWESPEVIVAADGLRWTGRMLLCTAGNGTSSGGGFKLTPHAALDDGELDICLAEDMSLRRIMAVLPRALAGSHIGQPEITSVRVPSITMAFSRGIPVHVDGEIAATDVRNVRIDVVPKALNVLRPNAS